MVNLLGFADIIGIERAAFAQLRRARGALDPPRHAPQTGQPQRCRRVTFFSLQLICDWGKTWRGIEP
jgi:hypothetical protein